MHEPNTSGRYLLDEQVAPLLSEESLHELHEMLTKAFVGRPISPSLMEGMRSMALGFFIGRGNRFGLPNNFMLVHVEDGIVNACQNYPKYPVDAAGYKQFAKTDPIQDDLERLNCAKAGEFGHSQCGPCVKHMMPRFMCGCFSLKEAN